MLCFNLLSVGMAVVQLSPKVANNLQRPNLFLSHNVYYGGQRD